MLLTTVTAVVSSLGAAPGFPWLVAGRAMQGIGVGLTPLAIAVARDELPHHRIALARHEEDLAATIAAGVPYWQPRPSSALGHTAAAAALRHEADRFAYVVALPSS